MAKSVPDWMEEGKPADPIGPTGKPIYEAFKPVDRRQVRVWLCPRLRAWEALPYIRLDRIIVNGTHGTSIALVWGYAVAVIEGTNLQKLGDALATEHCIRIVEFDADRFDPNPDANAPKVTSIKILVENCEDMIGAAAEVATEKPSLTT